MKQETPTISGYAMQATAYQPDMMVEWQGRQDATQRQLVQAQNQLVRQHMLTTDNTRTIVTGNLKENPVAQPNRRIVQVFIADPEESLPLDKSVLYRGEQKLTDLTDQELYFEVDIKSLLDQHNAFRTTVRNKAVKEREEKLEPARVRDLKMVVVTMAAF